ncbi:MAG: metallo-mystery pair system four-Cys motif protein [Candidatus Binatia bacterium]|nr:metallo-mystery pair system four-Cys motif protein [Candidatus Binatia bacterium]
MATRFVDSVRSAARARWIVSLVAAASMLVVPSMSHGQTIGTPDVSGDQLIFLYDARTNRTAFLTVANPSDDTIFLDIALYGQDLASQIAGQTVSLGPASNLVIDPTSFGGGGANGSAGLAVITPVMSMSDTTPVVPGQPISGGFTLANLTLMAGFGQNPFARLAMDGNSPASPGTAVDGNNAVYQRFDPGILMIPVYFNPADLGRPEDDGNRVLLAAFADDYDGGYRLLPVSTDAVGSFFNATGLRIAQNTVGVNGVLLSDLQSMAGESNLDGSSGKAFFEIDAKGGNVLGLFSQSISTFAAGQRMPSVAMVPNGTAAPVPVTLNFDARVNGEEFACNRTFTNIGSTNATVEPTDCRMYIENVRLVNDEGGEVPVTLDQDGAWQRQDVALLDFENGTGLCGQRGTAETNTNIRGMVPGDTYTRIRFEMGVPENMNHADSATALAPLNKTALFWSWNAGYKFIRYDNIVESNGNEFRVHIGATACQGDGRGNATCGNSNRIDVDLPFDPSSDTVLIDLASFLVGTNVEANTAETPPGCMSAPDDPECVGVFARAGLPYGGNPGGSQQIFTVE